MKIKLIFIAVIIIVVLACVLMHNRFNAPNSNQFGEKKFSIEKGQGVTQIADNLVNQGFLEKPLTFKIYVWLTGYRAQFIDGSYDLKTTMSIKQLIQAFNDQKNTNHEAIITIIEGWTDQDIDDYLVKQGKIQSNDLIKYSKNYHGLDYLFLLERPSRATLQGYLYPDTYRIYQNAKIDDIAAKMLNNFNEKLTAEMRAEIKKQKKSIFEIITLASIVEKEITSAENRRIVAGIFQKRLKIGMALQSDATVNYITHKGLVSPSIEDTKVDNLFNTYKYPGLPPGPICNPSIESIRAVIYPILTDYLYFLTTPDKQAVFSKTYDEHLRNKDKYLK